MGTHPPASQRRARREIARRDGVALSTVQRGVAAHLALVDTTASAARDVLDTVAPTDPALASPLLTVESPADLDPRALCLTAIRAIVDSMDDLARLSRTAGHAGARVGAAKGRIQAARELNRALALVGPLRTRDTRDCGPRSQGRSELSREAEATLSHARTEYAQACAALVLDETDEADVERIEREITEAERDVARYTAATR